MKESKYNKEKVLTDIITNSIYKKRYGNYSIKNINKIKSISKKVKTKNKIVDTLDDFLSSNDDIDFSKNNLTITKVGDKFEIRVNNIREEKIKKIFDDEK